MLASVLSVALAVRTLSLVSEVRAMQTWPTVSATLTSAALETSARRGSVRAVATYTYVVDGQTYTGSRATPYNGDSIGGFQQRIAGDLQARLARHETVAAHVDPADPHRSVLVPTLRWEIVGLDVVAVIVFGGVAAFAVRALRAPTVDVAPAMDEMSSGGQDAAAVDGPGEPAPPRLAWRRRLMALGVVVLGVAYAVTDTTGRRSTTMLERWLADEVAVSIEVRADSTPADRLRAAIDAAAASAATVPTVTRLDAARGVAFQVRMVAPRGDEASATSTAAAFVASLPDAFTPPRPADLMIAPPSPALPYRSEGVVARARVVTRGLLVAGVVLLGIGAWL